MASCQCLGYCKRIDPRRAVIRTFGPFLLFTFIRCGYRYEYLCFRSYAALVGPSYKIAIFWSFLGTLLASYRCLGYCTKIDPRHAAIGTFGPGKSRQKAKTPKAHLILFHKSRPKAKTANADISVFHKSRPKAKTANADISLFHKSWPKAKTANADLIFFHKSRPKAKPANADVIFFPQITAKS